MRGAFLALLILQTAPADAATVCLQRTQTASFAPRLGQRTVIVTDKSQRKYLVDFGGVCRALDYPGEVGFQTLQQSRLGCVERGDYLVSQRESGTGALGRSCGVRSVTVYTPEMEKAEAVQRAMDQRY